MINLYTLSDPLTGQIRYAGKTIGPLKERLKGHLKAARLGYKSHNANWLKSLLSKGLIPEINLYDTVLDTDWEDEERLMIAQLKNWGFDLTNQQLGGGHNRVEQLPEYHKQNISQGLLSSEIFKQGIDKRLSSGVNNPFYGKQHTLLTVDSISLSKSTGQVAVYDNNDKVISIFTSASKAAKDLKISKNTILKYIRKNEKYRLSESKYVAKYEGIR